MMIGLQLQYNTKTNIHPKRITYQYNTHYNRWHFSWNIFSCTPELPHIQNAEDLNDWFIIQEHFGQSMSINTQKGYKKYNMWHRRMYILHNSIVFSFSRWGRRGRTFEYMHENCQSAVSSCLRVYTYTFMLYIPLFLLDGPCNPVWKD